MKVFFKYFISILFSTSVVFSVSEAGAVWLLINPGAAAQGTGEAQVAKADDAYASYYNPAGLGFINKQQYAVQHVNWLPNLADDVYFEYVGYNKPLGTYGALGASLRYLNLGDQTATDASGNVLFDFASFMVAAQVGYGTKITENSSIGFNFKIFHQRLAEAESSGSGQGGGSDEGASTDIGFDIGYLMHFGKNKQHGFGLAVQNIGPPIDFVDAEQADPAPINMKLGLKLQLSKTETNELNFLFDMNKLLVAAYPAMDWNNDGVISGTDELAHSDEWYKGIINAWLDDWYYGGDYDYTIPSSYTASEIVRDFYYTQIDEPNKNYADGIIGGYIKDAWTHVSHGDLKDDILIGDSSTDWSPTVVLSSDPSASVYVPNYSGFCHEEYRTFTGYQNGIAQDGGYATESYSMCYDENGVNYRPDGDYDDDVSYGQHSWIDMPHDGFGPVDVYDVLCDSNANYDCTATTYGDSQNTNQPNSLRDFDYDGVVEDILFDAEQNYTRMDLPYKRLEDGVYVDQEFSYSDSRYGYYNPYGVVEKGSGDDRNFSKELEEVIFNFGFEYKYTENFTLRAGFIYDFEGDIKSPTLGAGIDFINYGFDFGYTLGETGAPRANTMFFSLKIDV